MQRRVELLHTHRQGCLGRSCHIIHLPSSTMHLRVATSNVTGRERCAKTPTQCQRRRGLHSIVDPRRKANNFTCRSCCSAPPFASGPYSLAGITIGFSLVYQELRSTHSLKQGAMLLLLPLPVKGRRMSCRRLWKGGG